MSDMTDEFRHFLLDEIMRYAQGVALELGFYLQRKREASEHGVAMPEWVWRRFGGNGYRLHVQPHEEDGCARFTLRSGDPLLLGLFLEQLSRLYEQLSQNAAAQQITIICRVIDPQA